ncbi:MAG: hypothetical protein J6S32_01355, partial [Clostridia bacterium]|nr:hypothetical protein [Clostridia bacterium]
MSNFRRDPRVKYPGPSNFDPCQIFIAAAKPAASAATGCVVKFYIAAAKFEKAAKSCYNIYTKDEG